MNNKKSNNKILAVLLALILVVLIILFVKPKTQNNAEISEEIRSESTNINVEYSEAELTGTWKDYKAKIQLSDEKIVIDGSGVTNSGNEIKITAGGSFYITGIATDCNIIIDANKEDDVQLVLENCEITSKETAPINGVECNVLTITSMKNSKNIISDVETYTKFTDSEKSEPNGAIFTKTDLVINGEGNLMVNANYLDGIVSKDTLKIVNTNIDITSKDDGIRGKDYVVINSSDIKINAGGDGVKSSNSEDIALGYIAIEGGNIDITSVNDGIQAETVLNISKNPEITITTTATQSSNNSNNDFKESPNGMPQRFTSGSDEMRKGSLSNKNEKLQSIPSDTAKMQQKQLTEDSRMKRDTLVVQEDSVSSKGLKAGSEITIENGNIKITSTDDSIHSNGITIINNGELQLSSEDDGIHADTNIIINGGNINISKSYEGIESGYIEINEGTINLVASDDGINVSGGADSSSMGGRPGHNNFSNLSDSNRKLVINGGNITVNASGDGLDSNGSMYIYGGTILVKGPTSNGDAPLDFDGEMVIDGGNLIAYGSSGMFELPSSSSKQNILVFNTSGNSGDEITLKDSSGIEVSSFKSEKNYQIVVISNSNIKSGEQYSLYVNGSQKESLQINSSITSNGGSINRGGMNRGNIKNGGYN